MPIQPTIFVVDDDAAMRGSMTALGAALGLATQEFASAADFLEAIEPTHAGCLVADVRMPGMSGLELQSKLSTLGVELPIIIITGHGDVPMSVKAMKQGAVDFLEKPFQPEQLAGCIQEAVALDARRRAHRSQQKEAESRLACLDAEERQVLLGIVDGKTNKAIADELDASLRTVQFRRASLMKKLATESKGELVELVRLAGRPSTDRYVPHAAHDSEPTPHGEFHPTLLKSAPRSE